MTTIMAADQTTQEPSEAAPPADPAPPPAPAARRRPSAGNLTQGAEIIRGYLRTLPKAPAFIG